MPPQIPVIQLRDLVNANPHLVRGRIESYLSLSQPAAFVEDTLPSESGIVPDVARVLVLPPIRFDLVQERKAKWDSKITAFLIADHPASPTWPYSTAETDLITRWGNWHAIGPMFQTATGEAIAEVKRRYGLDCSKRVYVFTMSGGSQFGTDDVQGFIAQATVYGERLRARNSRCRLLLVKGSCWRNVEIGIPPLFEVVEQEPLMPALLAASSGAVVTPTANAIWWCLRSGIPFLTIFSTRGDDPAAERLKRIGYCVPSLCHDVKDWEDESWRRHCASETRAILNRWTGEPDGGTLQSVFLTMDKWEGARTAAVISRIQRFRNKHLVLRIDDVTQLDDCLKQLLAECLKRALPASLEVIPYFCDFSESSLDALDGVRKLEISQHGFAHVPELGIGKAVGEFLSEGEPLPNLVSENVENGLRRLREAFPIRFAGGYSPPYDGLPVWLPALWKRLGGRYVSVIKDPNPHNLQLPVIQIGVDIWDWKRSEMRPLQNILTDIEFQTQRRGYAGLVIHPQPLQKRGQIVPFCALLDALQDSGLTGCTPSSLVESGVAPAINENIPG